MLHPTFKPYTDTITAPSAARCMRNSEINPSRIQAQEVAQKGPECDAKVCLTRPSNPLKTLGPEPRLVCFIQRSNPIQTLLPHLGSAMHAKQRNPSRIQAQEVAQKGPGCDAKVCLTRPSNPLKTLGWYALSNVQTLYRHYYRTLGSAMHAKQRNPSRIQAQEVAQKGPGCDAKVCLTRPSNPLKTLGPEPRLVCFIQRSNPIQTLLPHPRQRVQNGETPRCASPDLRTVEKH